MSRWCLLCEFKLLPTAALLLKRRPAEDMERHLRQNGTELFLEGWEGRGSDDVEEGGCGLCGLSDKTLHRASVEERCRYFAKELVLRAINPR